MKNIVLFIFVISIACAFKCSETNTEKVQASSKEIVVNANNSFGLSLLQTIDSNTTRNNNLFFSPASIFYTLSMAASGAENITYQAFNKTLCYNNTRDAVFEGFENIKEHFRLTENKSITFVNSMWVDRNFEIKKEYGDDLDDFFRTTYRQVDFTSPGTVDIINEWISLNTSGKIEKMLDQINQDEKLILANAIYFKEDWKQAFNKKSTLKKTFNTEDTGPIQVDFMSQKLQVPYFENEILQAIKLPYKDSNFYMEIIVPKSGIDIHSFIESSSLNQWKSIQNEYSTEEVKLSIPKFKIEFGTHDLSKILVEMGLGQAFSNSADFSRISDQSLALSRVLHKAFIDVNEKGSEAAAATTVGMRLTSFNLNEKVFNANRPFLFMICSKKPELILFIGKMAKPEY